MYIRYVIEEVKRRRKGEKVGRKIHLNEHLARQFRKIETRGRTATRVPPRLINVIYIVIRRYTDSLSPSLSLSLYSR